MPFSIKISIYLANTNFRYTKEKLSKICSRVCVCASMCVVCLIRVRSQCQNINMAEASLICVWNKLINWIQYVCVFVCFFLLLSTVCISCPPCCCVVRGKRRKHLKSCDMAEWCGQRWLTSERYIYIYIYAGYIKCTCRAV